MESQVFLLVCVLLPLMGSCLLPVLGRMNTVLRNLASLGLVLASFVCSFLMLPSILNGENILIQYDLPLGLTFGFLADGLSLFMSIIATMVAAVIVFYSFGYIEKADNQNEYYTMVVMFIGAMMGLVFSTNLVFLYVFWEISAICCWRLIGFYRKDAYVYRADKAFMITVGGAVLMLIGFIAIYIQTGTFDLLLLKGAGVDSWIVILILVGILSKSAILPLHSWLPDAGVAPSSVTALLHAAVLVKIGVYVFARLFLVNFQFEAIWSVIIPTIAAVSAIVSAGAAMVENDLKRIIAYSTVSQLSFILLGLSSNSLMGVAGGLLYILMHSLSKAGLFLCAGIVEHQTHTKDIRQMGGLVKRLPITCVAFALCAFSVMGLPPFGGFFAKYMVLNGAFSTDQLWLVITFFVGSLMTIVYLLRVFVKVFFGTCSHPDIREGSWEMVMSVCFFALLSLITGLFINVPAGFVNFVTDSIGRW